MLDYILIIVFVQGEKGDCNNNNNNNNNIDIRLLVIICANFVAILLEIISEEVNYRRSRFNINPPDRSMVAKFGLTQ